jgi:uncharacterized protein YhfF
MADNVPPVTPPENGGNGSGGKKGNYETPDQELRKFSISLDVGSTDPEIQPLLQEHGYPVEKIQALKGQVEKVSSLFSSKSMAHGNQLEASQEFQKKQEIANKCYRKTYKIAKELFKDNQKALAALELKGRRKKTISGWQRQTETFYTNLLAKPEFVSVMTEYGYPETKLSAELKLVQDAVAADIVHRKEVGESVGATANRDAEFDALEESMTRFYNIAKAVLEDNPQWLEKMGLK